MCGDALGTDGDVTDMETCCSCSVYGPANNAAGAAAAGTGASSSKTQPRSVEIISTDSDSSLASFDSVESPSTAWKRNQMRQQKHNKESPAAAAKSQ